MSEAKPKPNLIRATEHSSHGDFRWSFSHPFNAASSVEGFALSTIAGLTRAALNLMRVPPGKESFAFHRHAAEEEWVYVLSGRGVTEIGDATFEVGPGDFMGFPADGPAHLLKNPYDEDLVYLAGGERKDVEIADFPRNGKRLVRVGEKIAVHDLATAEAFPGYEKP
ncbi:MAG TPA: cupin domain-containing protein [Kofleriaceae bacterium]|nr:cupin domain-containing protein [Kofleriaceae bacterium]